MKVKKFKMVNVALCVFTLLVPILLFANVWYSFKGYQLEAEIREYEAEQSQLIERNKRLITGISVLRSPSRVIDEARKMGMILATEERITVIENEE